MLLREYNSSFFFFKPLAFPFREKESSPTILKPAHLFEFKARRLIGLISKSHWGLLYELSVDLALIDSRRARSRVIPFCYLSEVRSL